MAKDKLSQDTNTPPTAPPQPPPRRPRRDPIDRPAWDVPEGATAASPAGGKPDGQAGGLRPISFDEIVEQASRQGNLKETLNHMLAQVPERMEKFHLVNAIEDAWIELLSGGLKPVAEAIRRDVEQKRRELAGPSPTSLDKEVIDQIVAEWLAAKYASYMEATCRSGDLGKLRFCLQRAESANRRYNRACKTLAQIQKLQQGLRVEIHHHNTPEPAALVVAGVAAEAAEATVPDRNAVAPPAGPPACPAAPPPEPPVAERLQGMLTEARRVEAAVS